MHSREISLSYAIRWSIYIILSTLFVGYIIYQARFLLIGPVITLTHVPHAVQTERIVRISGEAYNITAITVNDRPVVTTETGYFEVPVVLENGYTVVSIAAQDRYGRSTSTELPFVYVPQSPLTI